MRGETAKFMFIFRKIQLCTFLVFLCCGTIVAQQPTPQPSPSPSPTQNPYVRKNSIGFKDNSSNSVKTPFQTRHISEWVGERFIFMPRQTVLQRYGYQLIQPIDEEYGKVAYEDYVGKVVKVLAVAPSKTRIEGVWEVYLEVEGKGEKLKASAFGETVDGLAYLQDIDDARTKYLGKTLRYNEQALTRYNAISDKVEFFVVPKNTLVKVVDIVVGWSQESPVRFVVQTPQKEEGFIDVNMSGTNISKILRKFNQFNDKFVLVD